QWEYPRRVVESVDCRAVALAKADNFEPGTSTQRAPTRQARPVGIPSRRRGERRLSRRNFSEGGPRFSLQQLWHRAMSRQARLTDALHVFALIHLRGSLLNYPGVGDAGRERNLINTGTE